MSVAFSVSLCGVGAAIVLTLVGILSNLEDRRNGVMLEVLPARGPGQGKGKGKQ